MRSLPLPIIRRLVPLRSLNEAALQALLEDSELVLVGRGQHVFTVAHHNRFVHYLLSGEAILRFAAKDVIHTAEIPYAMGFGESGLQSVVARTDCVCLKVDRAVLDRQLCWFQVSSAVELGLSSGQVSGDETDWQLTLLRSNLFLKVPPLNIDQIFQKLKPMQVRAGEVILQQGDVGDGCYFIRRGTASVTRQLPGEAAPRHLVDIGYGRCFGEDALIRDTVRNATVTMKSDGQLFRLDKPDFMVLLREPEPESINASGLASALESGVALLDMRTAEESEVLRCHSAQQVALPALGLLPSIGIDLGREYVVYCDTERRSRAAAYLLTGAGFNARYLQGGLDGLTEAQRHAWCEWPAPVYLHCEMASADAG